MKDTLLVLAYRLSSCTTLHWWHQGVRCKGKVVLQVVLLFEEDFWGSTDMFGRLAPSTAERGKFFLFYSYTGISGKPGTSADPERPCCV